MNHPLFHRSIAQRQAPGHSPLAQVALSHLIDQMIDAYVSWREACAAVAASYEDWCRAGREDRDRAFTAYVAALDGEERAAASYRTLFERIAPI